MIPENKLVDRNSNALKVAAALINANNFEGLCQFGELLTEQHLSLRKSFCVMTSMVDDVKVQALRDELQSSINKELNQ
jgi:galactokinase